MAERSRADELVAAAMRAVDEEAVSASEKAAMLMELAAGLQARPKAPSDLHAAITLYRAGIDLCEPGDRLLRARLQARLATAQIALSETGPDALLAARSALTEALPVLSADGTAAETAEAEMNLGLAAQSLAGLGAGRIQDAIAAYQRALRVFDKAAYPQEFAILQSNLAIAFLSIPVSDERSRLREALAVQAFEEALTVVTMIDHPREWAMLQNNLGNALQYAASSHPIENRLRALEAYNEALKVRSARTTPAEYANTVANKANCLSNLPDDPARPELGNPRNTRAALELYREAGQIFEALGEHDKRGSVAAAIEELQAVAA